jgi:photosystem II stability/assembly factor-like uncharacterized protein
MKTKLSFNKKNGLSLLIALFSISINAQTWATKATNFSILNTPVTQIAIANDNVVWSCNSASKVFSKSVDGGNTWTTGTINIGTSNTNITSITAVSAMKAWVCAYDYSISANLGVYATVNGGSTWTKQPTAYNQSASSFPNIIKFFDENNGITQGDPIDSNFEVYRTSNGGVNWTRVPTANFPALISGEYGVTGFFDATPDGSSIWFGSSGTAVRLFKSINYGVTWTATSLNLSTAPSLGLTFKDANIGFIYGKVAGVFSLQKTTDGGNTFSNITTSGFTGNVTNIKCVPNNNMIVLSATTSGLSYCNHLSSDTTLALQPFTNLINSQTFEFKNFYTGYAGGTNSTATNGIYKLNNTISLIGATIGTPWTSDVDFATTDGLNYTLSNYSFSNGDAKFRLNHAWVPFSLDWGSTNFPSGTAVSGGSNIPIATGSYDVNFNIATLAFSFVAPLSNETFINKKITLFPNPAKSSITIQTNESIRAVKIIDLSGRITTISNFTNNNIDVSNLANGMYFIMIKTDTGVFKEKFIKN